MNAMAGLAAIADEGVALDALDAAVRRRLAAPEGQGLPGQEAIDVTVVLRAWASCGARVTLPGASSWPGRLDEIAGGPSLLAWRGVPLAGGPAVAIVGQRRATAYGREIASWLADALARSGVSVISGGAVGIDAAAHRAAVDAGGRTVVVLGCGHGVTYPRVHARPGGLFEDVLRSGGTLVSEYLPDEPPRPHRVLARNRLVAGLADVVVVVEGGERSGALNTASHAADQGIPVLAVPGDVRAAGSAATNGLLAEGCGPCRGPHDILDLLKLVAPPRGDQDAGVPAEDAAAGLPEPVHRPLAAAFPRGLTIDELAAASGIPTGSVLAAITRARIAGTVTTEADRIRLRARPGQRG